MHPSIDTRSFFARYPDEKLLDHAFTKGRQNWFGFYEDDLGVQSGRLLVALYDEDGHIIHLASDSDREKDWVKISPEQMFQALAFPITIGEEDDMDRKVFIDKNSFTTTNS